MDVVGRNLVSECAYIARFDSFLHTPSMRTAPAEARCCGGMSCVQVFYLKEVAHGRHPDDPAAAFLE